MEWDDGHVSSFTSAQLRAACPCERCAAARGDPARPTKDRPGFWTPRAVQGLVWAGWVVSLIGWFLLFVEVELVVITGPVLAFIGLLTVIAATSASYWWAIVPAVGHWLTCLLFMGLVGARNWSPEEAEVPFIAMGAVYVAWTLPLAWWVRKQAPVAHVPGRCDRCGYLLFGLGQAPDPRCPECGERFDPAEVAHLPTPPPDGAPAPAVPSPVRAPVVAAESS